MKKNYLFIILILIINNLIAQKWQNTFGNPSWYESPSDIFECYDKGYIILGNNDNDQGWLIKTDINGELLWDKYFGDAGSIPILQAVEQDGAGNIYIGGLIKIDENIPSSIIFKLNQCGELQWCKAIYTENNDYSRIKDILNYNDSTLICLARHNEVDNENNNYLYNINSLTGNLRWKKPYASKANYPLLDQSSGARLYHFNNLLLIAGNCYTAYPNGDSNYFHLHPFFIGLDTSFKEKWVLPFGISDSLRGSALGAIPISDSIIMGFGMRRFGSISHSMLMFFDNYGNELGDTTIENEQISNNIISNSMNDMRWINDSLLFGSVGYDDLDEVRHFCDLKIDVEGNVYTVVMVDTNAGGGGMVKTFDDKYVVTTGYYQGSNGQIYLYKKNSDLEQDTIYPGNYTYDSLCEEPITSGTISLGGCDIITNIKDVPTLEEYNQNKKTVPIKVYPNPSKGTEITFQYQNTAYHQNMELRCYNIFGTQVYREKIYRNQGESKVDVRNWKPGMYFALVYSNDKVLGQAKFVVK